MEWAEFIERCEMKKKQRMLQTAIPSRSRLSAHTSRDYSSTEETSPDDRAETNAGEKDPNGTTDVSDSLSISSLFSFKRYSNQSIWPSRKYREQLSRRFARERKARRESMRGGSRPGEKNHTVARSNENGDSVDSRLAETASPMQLYAGDPH